MKRVFPWWLLLVAFVLVPLAEIFVIVQVGQVIGAWWTIALLVADSVLGAWLVKREGRRAWRALRVALHEGRMPARELADGMLILIGGTLMLTPGFLSDVLGTLCVLPLTRPLGRRVLSGFLTRKLLATRGQVHTVRGTPRATRNGYPGGPDVVPGEVVD